MALQFHPDKNKAPGAAEAFKAIGKAFAVLSDTQKRRQYDQCPSAFDPTESSSSSSPSYRREQYNNHHTYQTYWNDDDFSAEEIFNMFFGGGFTNASMNRHRGARTRSSQYTNAHTNFTYNTQSVSFLFEKKKFIKYNTHSFNK